VNTEVGKHLVMGFWGFADKFLPVLYGVAYLLLVVRALSPAEFGNFVLIQEIFLIISGLGMSFALQPLLKYAAEEQTKPASLLTVCSAYYFVFSVLATAIVLLLRIQLGSLLNSGSLPGLLLLLPLLVATAYPRNVTLTLLQAHLRMKEVFYVDAVHFLGAPTMIWGWAQVHGFQSAQDLVVILSISQTVSSLVGVSLSRGRLRFTRSPDRKDMHKVWNYGKYTLGSTLSSLTASKADTFVLSSLTGLSEVALYNSVKVFARVYDMATQVIQMFVVPVSSRLSSRRDERSLIALIEKGILFGSLGMIPVFLIFGFFPGTLLEVFYRGKYLNGIPVMRILACVALITPALAVGGTTLLGLGKVRTSFWIGVLAITANLTAYFIFIPTYGAVGAALGLTISGYLITGVLLVKLKEIVPFTARGVFSRFCDITMFVKQRLLH
jgi:lipopolysaccharide exporter